MSYQVLALKYRPQTFEDVVGQSHVTTTLTNAIRSSRVAHAMLFTGPRGTGKTTIARILAKAMNCQSGPAPVPCNTCQICKDITSGHCADVLEIDGASNNSVDQIRELRENVTYRPSASLLKIYIIDEVHMLSNAAFNALLKTLEEPPDHVMFIFATTEVHKIPATILSRCQRHDLNRINLPMIADHLNTLAVKEGFNISASGLELIAQEADGSIRDALSLMDRVLSSSQAGDISLENVLERLGLIDTQVMHDIAAYIFSRNGSGIINRLSDIDNAGMDLTKAYSDLILFFRNLNVIQICGEKAAALNLSGDQAEKLSALGADISSSRINSLLQTLLANETLVRTSAHTRTAIETVLLKLVLTDPGDGIDTVIEQLDRLSQKIAGAPAATQLDIAQPAVPDPDLSQQKKKTESETAQTTPAPEPQSATGPDKNWPGFLKKLEATLPYLSVILAKGHISESNPGHITLTLDQCSKFDEQRVKSKQNELQNACSTFLNKKLTLQLVSRDTERVQMEKKKEAKAKKAALNHPFVVDAQKIFNGEIINY